MLVVTVEIWPYGDPEHPRRIARIGAAQTSVVAGNVADYEAVVIVDDEDSARIAHRPVLVGVPEDCALKGCKGALGRRQAHVESVPIGKKSHE